MVQESTMTSQFNLSYYSVRRFTMKKYLTAWIILTGITLSSFQGKAQQDTCQYEVAITHFKLTKSYELMVSDKAADLYLKLYDITPGGEGILSKQKRWDSSIVDEADKESYSLQLGYDIDGTTLNTITVFKNALNSWIGSPNLDHSKIMVASHKTTLLVGAFDWDQIRNEIICDPIKPNGKEINLSRSQWIKTEPDDYWDNEFSTDKYEFYVAKSTYVFSCGGIQLDLQFYKACPISSK